MGQQERMLGNGDWASQKAQVQGNFRKGVYEQNTSVMYQMFWPSLRPWDQIEVEALGRESNSKTKTRFFPRELPSTYFIGETPRRIGKCL